MLTDTGWFSEDTQAPIGDVIKSIPVVAEAPLPCSVAEIPASDDVEQQSLAVTAVTPVEAYDIPPCTIIETPTSSEVEAQLTESTSVVAETPCSVITAIETPASSEVDEQPPAITPAEAPEALNANWYVELHFRDGRWLIWISALAPKRMRRTPRAHR